ncbi:hypothetical protein CRUP_009917 [Coryphaenoides rupestris]|nr:hypothetical protein CRUP_009917 [Coryphaenoides rupestris]
MQIMGAYEDNRETCGTICLKYLLITFNFLFWVAGGVVMAVGVWTLVEKSDYISLLSSKSYAASAYILVLAGAIVMVTGVLGCCATFKEQRRLLRVFKCCGSNSSGDWGDSAWIRSSKAQGRLVPDSCCKSPMDGCGQRDHPSNIYKVEGGCITKLENFILDHLKIIGAVGVGIACVQGTPRPRDAPSSLVALRPSLLRNASRFGGCSATQLFFVFV